MSNLKLATPYIQGMTTSTEYDNYTITTVSGSEELEQIVALSSQNTKQHLNEDEKNDQGFLTWQYTLPLLQQMHQLAPSIIAKDGDHVIGYALVALMGAKTSYAELLAMMTILEKLHYKGKSISQYSYYFMGQICVDKNYRGKGLFDAMYKEHKKLYRQQFDCLITSISTSNHRSIRAHERVGFTAIHTYKDATDEWLVVLWDWAN